MRGSAASWPELGPAGGAVPSSKPSKRRRPSLVVQPRLLDLDASAVYLGGLARRTVGNLLAAGTLHRVRVPGLDRVLLDRHELDELIAAWTDGPESPRSSA